MKLSTENSKMILLCLMRMANLKCRLRLNYFATRVEGPATRAELNEREAPGNVVAARPSKRITQLRMRSVSHAVVSTSQKHR